MAPLAEQDIVVQSPVVEPYDHAAIRHCRACGIAYNRWDRLDGWLRHSRAGIAKTRYCAGGKAPTEDRGMMAAMMTGESEVFNPCAGVSRPHLHVTCINCGFVFLMATLAGCEKAS